MRSIIQFAAGFTDRIQWRFLRSRRGSVLIIVVVLVVILALMGTAMLSTTRTDRYRARQNSTTLNLDLMVQSVETMARAQILSDLYGPGAAGGLIYRPVTDTSVAPPANAYDHWDSPDLNTGTLGGTFPSPNDNWLSPRLPSMVTLGNAPGTPTPFWQTVGTSPIGNVFDSPAVFSSQTGTVTNAVQSSYAQRISIPGSAAGRPSALLAPTYVTIQGEKYPAWFLPAPGSGPDTAPLYYYIAADTDGDGIADSSLFKLPVGEIDGVTYYGAMRIIDNNSTINVNTAWSRASDFDFNGNATANAVDALGNPLTANTTNLGIFRSHVGLQELLNPGNSVNPISEMYSVNHYRFNYGSTITPPFVAYDSNPGDDGSHSGIPIDERDSAATPANQQAQKRTDFLFATQGDSMENQLVRRTGYPGLRTPDSAIGKFDGIQYQPFTISDSAALAYHFTLINPNNMSSLESTFANGYQFSSGALTSTFPDSLYRTAANFNPPGTPAQVGHIPGKTSYQASDVNQWYDDNFNYDGLINTAAGFTDNSTYPQYFRPLRPLLSGFNPVSNIAPKRLDSASIPAGMEAYPTNTSPAKTSINTAPFAELWRAFWSVMSENNSANQSGTPFSVASTFPTPNAFDSSYAQNVYEGNQFDSATFAPTATPRHPQRMFRSPLRDMRAPAFGTYMEPKDVLTLRAALAAANAVNMRHPNPYDLPHPISIPVWTDGTHHTASTDIQFNVYGARPQPFITEVFANTDPDPNNVNPNVSNPLPNPNGYVAIELYNPFNQDISLMNWTLAVIDRHATQTPQNYPSAGLNYYYISTGSAPDLTHATAPWRFDDSMAVNAVKIPAHSFIVLDNFANGSPIANAAAATALPPNMTIAANVSEVYVPNLHWVIEDATNHGGELVLLQPVLDPTSTTPNYSNERATFTVPNASMQALGLPTSPNSMPVDSFDFTGIKAYTIANAPGFAHNTFYMLHYSRENTTANQPAWRFVYPGRYDATQPQQRQQGTQLIPFDKEAGPPPGIPTPTPTPAVLLGAPDPTDTRVGASRQTIEMFFPAGPRPVAASSNKFPFGGFMRNGDILEVPFVGAYTVTLTNGTTLLESNAITIDSAFAEDTDISDDEPSTPSAGVVHEQVGRFAPVDASTTLNDLDPVGTYDYNSGSNTKWNYRWATKLFDYLTVQAPSNDYLPNVKPLEYGVAGSNPAVSGGPRPKAVKNSDAANAADPDLTPAPDQKAFTEEAVPLQGLININTAPWKVLSALPWVPANQTDGFSFDETTGIFTTGSDANHRDDNIDIAKAIVAWRDGLIGPQGNYLIFPHQAQVGGPASSVPFTSIYDLYRVQDAAGTFVLRAVQNVVLAAGDPDDAQGDFQPYNLSTPAPATPVDGIRYDFKEQNLLLTRLSNLISMRSDSFTVYVLVQGWRGVGTATPTLVVQRRAAFIQDRSPVTEFNTRLPAAVNVPND
jgi:hypothetical protein